MKAILLSAVAWLHVFPLLLSGTARAQAGLMPGPPPLRDLPKDRPYVLRVLYLEDSRLPTLMPKQRSELYQDLERRLGTSYGYQVHLREVGRRNLAEYFSAQQGIFARCASMIRSVDIDVTTSMGLGKLRRTIISDFSPRALPQIERYLRAGPLTSKAEAVKMAQQQFLRRLDELRDIQLDDGRPFFDASEARTTSFVHWAALMEETTEADLVFSNSMVVSGDTEMPIYVIARGGLSTGLTNNNSRSPYQAATMVGLFPFLSDASVFLRERGRIPENERLDVIATFCMHELGHLFLRFAEHYDHPHCVHVAPTGLNYYEWYKSNRDGGPCSLEHRKTKRF